MEKKDDDSEKEKEVISCYLHFQEYKLTGSVNDY